MKHISYTEVEAVSVSCEWLQCQDWNGEKCTNTLDYVNRKTGEAMCPLNIDAMPRECWEDIDHLLESKD